MSKKLITLRQNIEEIDNLIFSNLEERKKLVTSINTEKALQNIPIQDLDREKELEEKYAKWLKDPYIKDIFNFIAHTGKKELRTYKVGLIGSSLKHSLSPAIHKLISQISNINYEFSLFEISPENLDINLIKEKLLNYEYNGFFITMPYKGKFLEICDVIGKNAFHSQNINLIYYDGKNIVGDNTDYLGFSYAIEKYMKQLIHHQPFILGSGMASKTVNSVLLNLGFKTPIIVSLDPNNKNEIDYLMLKELLPTFVINTTPVGSLYSVNNSVLDGVDTSKLEFVFDLVYNPSVTKTMAMSKHATNGLEMLVVQAISGIEKIFSVNLLNKKIIKHILESLEND